MDGLPALLVSRRMYSCTAEWALAQMSMRLAAMSGPPIPLGHMWCASMGTYSLCLCTPHVRVMLSHSLCVVRRQNGARAAARRAHTTPKTKCSTAQTPRMAAHIQAMVAKFMADLTGLGC